MSSGGAPRSVESYSVSVMTDADLVRENMYWVVIADSDGTPKAELKVPTRLLVEHLSGLEIVVDILAMMLGGRVNRPMGHQLWARNRARMFVEQFGGKSEAL